MPLTSDHATPPARYPRPLLLGILAAAAIVGLGLLAVDMLGDSTWWRSLLIEIQAQQRALHQQLAGAIRAVKNEGYVAGWTLVSLSFLYGVFHAAGPGHGKMVIATYLATQESRLARGLSLSVLSAFAQAVTAVVLVEVTVTILGQAMRSAQSTISTLEAASFALVAVLGAGLAFVASRRLLRRLRTSVPGFAHHRAHAHGQDHSHNPHP